MELKKSMGRFSSGRLFCFFSAAVFLFFYAEYFLRELWFDEVLTLQFAFLPSVSEIYRSYTIPNNQLIHTFFIHWLWNGGIAPEYMRLFPLLCGGVMIFLLWKNFSRQLGKTALAAALTALVISPPFLLYASALRGYMLAALFTVCALCGGKRFALGGRKIWLGIWFIASLLAAGVMPAALAGIAAAGLYIAPYCGKKFWKNPRLYALAAAPFAAFVCFYGRIYENLLKAFELKEGWHHGGYALLAIAVIAGATFLVPLISAAFRHRPRLRDWPRTLIWLLPLGGLLLPVYPFPRVWFVLFPIFALLAAGYLRKVPEKYVRITAVAALIWGAAMSAEFSRKLLSPAVSLAGQDDFYAPRFVSGHFRPSETAAAISKNFGLDYPVFVSFEADPFAVWYCRPTVIMDVPPGKRKNLPPGTVIVLGAEEDPDDFARRFDLELREIYRNELHKVYISGIVR